MLTIERSSFEEWNKVSNKEELTDELDRCKNILSPSFIEYLEELINLKFSVIRPFVSDEERKILGQLSIYKNIAIYNIYTRVLNIFNGSNKELEIMDNSCGLEGISVKNGGTQTLFTYDYSKEQDAGCGVINIHQYSHSENKLKQELRRLKTELKKANANPDSSFYEIYNLKSACSKMENSVFDEKEKRIIEISKEFNDLLLEDFGLAKKDFDFAGNNFEESKVLEKKLKSTPNVKIYRSVHYI